MVGDLGGLDGLLYGGGQGSFDGEECLDTYASAAARLMTPEFVGSVLISDCVVIVPRTVSRIVESLTSMSSGARLNRSRCGSVSAVSERVTRGAGLRKL